MRLSHYFIATQKETPSDAETISHQLMIRAGFIRKLATGLYTWLPLGLRVLRKVEAIVREEMNRSGALEILMPAIQPAELWQESGRWEQYGPELLRLKDRHERLFCFGPTHEEVVTELARREIKSYKQLPLHFYQIQIKFRDEIRPRFGVMRAREFVMKDGYSFHLTEQSLHDTYEKMYQTYTTILTRLGLQFRAVTADTGSIGGESSHEFHVLADAGEDSIVFSDTGPYAANLELATAQLTQTRNDPKQPLTKVATPTERTIQEVCQALHMNPEQSVKVLLVKGTETPVVALLLRGDHALNITKAEKLKEVAKPLTFASEEAIQTQVGCQTGFIGPIGLTISCIVDKTAAVLSDFVCGANQAGYHFTGVNWGRDLKEPWTADLRNVVAGDTSPDGQGKLEIKRGIEVGHIFKLGKKYSQAMRALVQNEAGENLPLMMGCYGMGISRMVAAAIEQYHDGAGMLWPKAMAPFQISLIPILRSNSTVLEQVELLYHTLVTAGFEVLFDDRDERPGIKFSESDLIGIPHRLVVSEKTLSLNQVEYKNRQTGETQGIPLTEVVSFFNRLLA